MKKETPLGSLEVVRIIKRLRKVAPYIERLVEGWIRQRIVLKYLFDLFRDDEHGMRSQSHSVRTSNLNDAKKSVDMEDKKKGDPNK